MNGYRKSFWLFTRGILARAYFWGFALLLDPFDIIQRIKPEWAEWIIVPTPLAFLILLILLLWCGALTYHELRMKYPDFHFERNGWLQDAVFYAVHGRWLGQNERALDQEGQFEKAAKILSEMRDLARDGKFKVWGKEGSSFAYDLIEPDYWRNYQIDTLAFAGKEPEHVKTEITSFSQHQKIYESLMISREQIEQIWRPKRKLKLKKPWEFVEA